MKVTKHGKFLYQLTRLKMFNCYLVEEDSGFTLIDTGLSNSAKKITEIARRYSLPISRITLTHTHTDHAGSFDEICQMWPEAEVALTERTARFLRGERQLLPHEPTAKLKGQYLIRTTKPTHILNLGDRLGSLELIPAPGHTPDHTAFFDHRDGTLIAGDALQIQGGIAVAGKLRLLFPFPAMATWHKKTALQTAQNLYDLKPSRLAVGHGPVLENPQAAMSKAIAQASQ